MDIRIFTRSFFLAVPNNYRELILNRRSAQKKKKLSISV